MEIETLMVLFICVEAAQMAGILYNTRKTNQLINDLLTNPDVGGAVLANGAVGMANHLKANPEAQQAFGELVVWMGSCVSGAVSQGIKNNMPKMPKIKSPMDLLGMLWQSPQIQKAVEKKVGDMAGGLAEDAAEAVTTGWVK